MKPWLAVISLLGLILSQSVVGAQSTGRTLVLGGIPYFVPPSPVSALHDTVALSVVVKSASDGLVPFSVIPTSKHVFDSAALQETVDSWAAKDDVWSKAFLTGTYVVHWQSPRKG